MQAWRQIGLLLRPRVAHLGAHGSAVEHPSGTAELAAAIATRVRRGRPYSVTAVALFADGVEVPDRLVLVGVRYIVDRFAAEFAEQQRKAGRSQDTRAAVDADALSIAEALASKLLAGNSRAVRTWRRNLRAHPPQDVTATNREDVLSGAVTSMMRMLMSDPPDSDDSLTELAAAAGVDGAFAVAPFAEEPAVPEGPAVLRGLFAELSIADLVECARQVTVERLRHAAAVMLAIWQTLNSMPPEIGYFFGAPAAPPPNGEDPDAFALFLVSFVRMSRGGFDMEGLGALLTLVEQLGLLPSDVVTDAVRSASWLSSEATA